MEISNNKDIFIFSCNITWRFIKLFKKAVFVTIMWWFVSKSYTPFLRNCDFQAYSFKGAVFVYIQSFSYLLNLP